MLQVFHGIIYMIYERCDNWKMSKVILSLKPFYSTLFSLFSDMRSLEANSSITNRSLDKGHCYLYVLKGCKWALAKFLLMNRFANAISRFWVSMVASLFTNRHPYGLPLMKIIKQLSTLIGRIGHAGALPINSTAFLSPPGGLTLPIPPVTLSYALVSITITRHKTLQGFVL